MQSMLRKCSWISLFGGETSCSVAGALSIEAFIMKCNLILIVCPCDLHGLKSMNDVFIFKMVFYLLRIRIFC